MTQPPKNVRNEVLIVEAAGLQARLEDIRKGLDESGRDKKLLI
ncbi:MULTISPECIES: hypothetical protein [Bacillus cereus group]|nr:MULTISPECIES: hypothetical protein [Bacillus cereus group]EEM55821.1 hypothetical protein bthur0007_63770 [Bacillus thuringiensis serovar monterrey BGSC 4AJ1]MEB9674150.1 hypothetical protein [Bacillus anthracis]